MAPKGKPSPSRVSPAAARQLPGVQPESCDQASSDVPVGALLGTELPDGQKAPATTAALPSSPSQAAGSSETVMRPGAGLGSLTMCHTAIAPATDPRRTSTPPPPGSA